MNDRKRILIIENSVALTGSLRTVLRTSIALRNKYDFIFILPTGSQASGLVIENNFKLYEVPLYELNRNPGSVFLYVPRLIRSVYTVRKIALEEAVSIVQVGDFYNLIMPLWRLFGGSVPYLCFINFVPNRFPFLIRKLWINCHLLFSIKMVAVSQYVLKQLPQRKKVICIPNALPMEDNRPHDMMEKTKRIIFLGNIISGKGQDLAIEAFGRIAASYPDWSLKIVGGDMGLKKNRIYKSVLQKRILELGLGNQMEITGFVEDIANEYQEASIALNFSISESFSLTIQEAMFYGCATIATASGGPSELIEDGHSGILVPVNNLERMSQAIKYLIDSPDERERLMANAHKSIREKCGYEKTIKLIDETYQSMPKPY